MFKPSRNYYSHFWGEGEEREKERKTNLKKSFERENFCEVVLKSILPLNFEHILRFH